MTNLHDKFLPSVSAFEDYKLSQDPKRDVSWRWEDIRNAAGVWEVQSAHLLWRWSRELLERLHMLREVSKQTERGSWQTCKESPNNDACTAHESLLRPYYSGAKVIKHIKYCCNHLNTVFHIRPHFPENKFHITYKQMWYKQNFF